MKNNYLNLIFLIFLSLLITSNIESSEEFNFNVSEIKISDDGNLYEGYGGGEIFTNDGIEITSENFEYDKKTQHLKLKDNVRYEDKNKNLIIMQIKFHILNMKKKLLLKAMYLSKIKKFQ